MSDPILSIQNLHVRFDTYAGTVHAVNGMSFEMQPGEMFGLVGESGCGKSVTGMAVLRSVPPRAASKTVRYISKGRTSWLKAKMRCDRCAASGSP